LVSTLKKELNKSKNKYFQKKIENSDNIQKTVWSIINSEVGENEKKPLKNIILEQNSEIILNPKKIANMFNE
jgi:hypothetical protein